MVMADYALLIRPTVLMGQASVMRHPWGVEGRLDAAVTAADDFGGDGADKGIERLGADRVDDALADRRRIEAGGGEPFGQHRLVAGANLRSAHVVGPVAGAAGDVGADRAGAQHRDADIGAVQLVLQGFGQRQDRVPGHRIRPLVGAAAVLEAGDRGGIDDMPLFTVLQHGREEVTDAVNDAPQIDADRELPVAARHVDEAGAMHRHAGVVAGDVQLAEMALGFGQRVEHGLLLRDVVRTGMTRLLVPDRPCAAPSTASFWMSASTTLAPASASAVAIASPMPDAAPVTMAVLPEMSMRHGPFR